MLEDTLTQHWEGHKDSLAARGVDVKVRQQEQCWNWEEEEGVGLTFEVLGFRF